MSKVDFNGKNRLITVKNNTQLIDVGADLYSEWKRWVQIGNNSSFAPAFRTFGGDNTSGGQTAPKYFFLMNGWKIVVDGQYTVFASNLYADDGNSPFVLLNGGNVLNKVSDSPTVSVSETLNPDEHDALMGLEQVIIDSRNSILSDVSDKQIEALLKIVDAKTEILSGILSGKNEIISLVSSEKDDLSLQLGKTSDELSQKMDLISQLINGNKYKAFV